MSLTQASRKGWAGQQKFLIVRGLNMAHPLLKNTLTMMTVKSAMQMMTTLQPLS